MPTRTPRRLVPPDVAALAAGVQPATLRQWVHRGHLHPHDGPHGRHYDLDQLTTLITRRRTPTPTPTGHHVGNQLDEVSRSGM